MVCGLFTTANKRLRAAGAVFIVFIVFIVSPAPICGLCRSRRSARRAGCRSAGVPLSVAPRAYRPVVKDPAVWEVSKLKAGPRTRRQFVPSAQEPKGATRRRFGRRTRPKAGGRSGDEQ